MRKIIFTILITSILSISNTEAENIDCTQFKKISAKYLECTTKNLKVNSKELKQKITTKTKNSKKKFKKSTLNAKLLKFKNSKSLTKVWRNKYVI